MKYLVSPTSFRASRKYDQDFDNLTDARTYAAKVSKRLSERGVFRVDVYGYKLLEIYKGGNLDVIYRKEA